ncbi:hypothetical protein BU16DRAFT_540895 [Lophium mytilinum]|uniref:Uncharacterized protein n=1 Tax=Lophium mytilinum TaxID=390894 RepID=A0A6A6QM31_9PEZI|nr:hypothetical protein BU16DRAFT_540895 [Lophium mytilinum]
MDREKGHRPRLKIFFLDGVPKDPSRLPITSSLLGEIFSTYKVNSRFADFVHRQHMPGQASQSTTSLDHELWFSAVIRSHESYRGKRTDLSRSVIDWQRCCIWGDHHATGDFTYMIWRCPLYIKEMFRETFIGPDGSNLLYHPMLVHAFLAENIVVHAYDFLKYFAEPLYSWENKADELRTAEDYTQRSKAFLALSRQIHQVATDYDILEATIAHLRKESKWYKEAKVAESFDPSTTRKMHSAQRILDEIFENLAREVKLIGTYSNLYLERAKIGVDECFAMMTQRDSEINLRMAAESTNMARASQEDNRSLRVIQIIGAIFLPGSFIASIFGMGFFTTNVNDQGNAVFSASSRWWIYLAVAVPVTILILILMGAYQMWSDALARKKEKSDTLDDVEDIIEQMKRSRSRGSKAG